MTDRYSIGKRLKEYAQTKKLTQKALAQQIGVTPGFVSQVINGEEDITARFIAGLVENFAELNMNWLLKGEGDMFFEKEVDVLLSTTVEED